MHFIYALANFIILVFLVWKFGGKLIRKIFSSRREDINRKLDAALAAESAYAVRMEEEKMSAEQSETEPAAESFDDSEYIKMTESRLLEIGNETRLLKENLRREMLAEVKEDLVKAALHNVRNLLTSEPYLTRLKNQQFSYSKKLFDVLALTPGDMAYLKTKNVLYVTLTSAHKLDDSIIEDIKTRTSEMVEAVGGKISFWVRENPRLLGGFELKVGDTVYGCSVDDELYYLGSSLRKLPILPDDDTKTLGKRMEETIRDVDLNVRMYQRGRVLSVSDGICWMDGLADIMYGEVVEFENGDRGMVLDIKQDRIGCVIYGSYEHIESGTKVRRVGRMAQVPVGDAMLGRVVDPLGRPVDGKGRIWTSEKRPIEFAAPTIPDRSAVNRPMHTGLKAIDALVPIGRGQRELIIGDRQTGKSAIAVDAIINQRGKNTVCVYVAIGQKDSTVAEIKERLESSGAMEYTIILSAPASSSASFQYIAPFAGTAMAEYFMYEGRDVLIVYDDLSKHAVAYREISLLLHRPSGREAYPGDVFYLHSRLLERSAQLSNEKGGGSITALPIIETQAGDISAYIPTNVISITDGQIFLESDMFNAGQRPAVNVGLSVSRVGGAAQTGLMKQCAGKLRMQLAQYRELASFAQFGADLDAASKAVLAKGELMMAALRQERYSPLEDWQIAVLLHAVSEGFADGRKPDEMAEYQRYLFGYLLSSEPELVKQLKTGKKLDKDSLGKLDSALSSLKEADSDAEFKRA